MIGTVCRVCGCTEIRACPGPCFWVEPDLCSACVVMVDREPDGSEDEEDEGLLGFGRCCGCGTVTGVRNIVMLDVPAPTPGTGWGCAVCGLPADGAVAVLCDDCQSGQRIDWVCDGYPSLGKRVLLTDVNGRFCHDAAAHAEQQ